MNKKLLVALAGLLKIDLQKLKDSLEKEDGDSSLVSEYNDKYKAFTQDELTTLTNNKIQAKFEELGKGQVGDGQIPQDLYEKIGASFLEKRERKISQKYGVEEYKGIYDLVEKVAEAQKSGKDGASDDEKDKLIITLKDSIKELEQENEKIKKESDEKLDTELASRDQNTAFDAFSKKMDYDSEKNGEGLSVLEKQTTLLKSAFSNEYNIIRKDGKTVVAKGEEVVTDNLGDPKPIVAVVEDFAKSYGFKMKEPDGGGRGSGGSDTKSEIKGVSFEELLKSRDIKPNTDESDKAYAEWKAANE